MTKIAEIDDEEETEETENICGDTGKSLADNLSFQVLNSMIVGKKCNGCEAIFEGFDWALTQSIGIICADCRNLLLTEVWGTA